MALEVKKYRFALGIFLALAGFFAGFFMFKNIYGKKQIDIAHFNGTYLENPRSINTFSLTGTDDKTFDNARLQGQWTLVFFGFTQCGYLCPTTMAELAKMYRLLNEKKVKNLPKVVLITLDPERDSLDKLKSYVKAFNPAFEGARGEEEVIQLMTHEMGVAYAKIAMKNAEDPENYDIQHSGAIMVFNPQGELNAFFTSPHNAESLAKDYISLIS